MRKHVILLALGLLAVMSAQAQFAKPLKKKGEAKNVFCLGLTGSYAANDMIYSAVNESKMLPVFAPTFGLVAEWNTMQRLSMGVDVSYVMRGNRESFATEFQTSYTTTTFVRVNYDMSLNGIELRVPIALYFGDGEHLRPYFYLAPRIDVWLDGNVHWERTYDDASFQPITFDSELTDAMTLPFDFSAEAGVGLCSRLKLGRRAMYVKLDVGYGFSLLSNFSQGEVNEEVVFEGWGDIAHERLGQRHLQNAEVRLTLLLPLQKLADDACSFNQRPYRPK